MASNSIVGAPTSIKPQPQSRLLSIPGETRKLILEHALPSQSHLILHLKSRPNSYGGRPQRNPYGSTAALLRVSKQVYQEAVPLRYSRNIPTIMTPVSYGLLDHKLPPESLVSIKKLEAAVDSKLFELGGIWDSLVRVLPSTTELVLNFHGCSDLMKPMGELMWRARRDQSSTLKLELRDSQALSSGAYHLPVTKHDIEVALDWGCLQALMYDFKPVPHLTTITMRVTLLASAWRIFADYQDDHLQWRFSKDGNRDTKTAKYLVWEEVTTT